MRHCGTLAQASAYAPDVTTALGLAPGCGNRTLPEAPPGSYEICAVCFWEHDPMQAEDPDYKGGANVVSLNTARRNFQDFGASEERFTVNVRPPNPDEQA